MRPAASAQSCLRIALTPGEPAGIGPDLTVMLAQRAQQYELVVFADPILLQQRAKLLSLPALRIREYRPAETPRPLEAGELCVASTALVQPVTPGKLDTANAAYVLSTLKQATTECLNFHCDALLTAPVHKGVINDAGVTFSGHTELFAELSGSARVVMMLATEGLRVALVTTHLPLRAIADSITPALLEEVIQILHSELQSKFAIVAPRIIVAGLNPHAGEGGHLGREELDIIEPTLQRLRARGMQLQGPLPADTLFTDKYLSHCDAVLAMYHDQGLPVLKYRGFGRAANITLGLPFIRSSVDHGTALELAGTGKADCGSMHYALDCAIEMAQKQKELL